MTTASIIVPTRGPRLAYLDVALASVAPQAAAHGADVVVVHDDRPDEATRALTGRHGATYIAHGRPLGINGARNTWLESGSGDMLCLLDDDVRVSANAFAQIMTIPVSLLVPVLAISSITSEWSQRTGLVSFTLEPHRMRVVWAKYATVLILALATLAVLDPDALRRALADGDATTLTRVPGIGRKGAERMVLELRDKVVAPVPAAAAPARRRRRTSPSNSSAPGSPSRASRPAPRHASTAVVSISPG